LEKTQSLIFSSFFLANPAEINQTAFGFMKIVFLSFHSGRVSRGVETYVHELGNQLVRLGEEVTVIQSGPALPESLYKTVSFNSPQFNFNFLAFNHVDKDTDIVIPTGGREQSLMAKAWSAGKKARIVISGQSGPGIDDRLNLYTFPSVFVGLTDAQCQWAKRVNPVVHVEKISNGVDLSKFSPHGSVLKTNLPGPIVLSVAALEPIKRLDLLIEAVSLTTASLLLVGQGSLKNSLSSLGQSRLPGRFKIMSLDYHCIDDAYRAARLFLFPTSSWESFGIVMLEAMASGLPVVATDDPIRREIVGNAGLFADPENLTDFAKQIELGLIKKWGSRPVNQAEKYSWDRIARQYLSLFATIAKG
jgi:glycosyltransferase involved in cell wall biosynthesis